MKLAKLFLLILTLGSTARAQCTVIFGFQQTAEWARVLEDRLVIERATWGRWWAPGGFVEWWALPNYAGWKPKSLTNLKGGLGINCHSGDMRHVDNLIWNVVSQKTDPTAIYAYMERVWPLLKARYAPDFTLVQPIIGCTGDCTILAGNQAEAWAPVARQAIELFLKAHPVSSIKRGVVLSWPAEAFEDGRNLRPEYEQITAQLMLDQFTDRWGIQ